MEYLIAGIAVVIAIVIAYISGRKGGADDEKMDNLKYINDQLKKQRDIPPITNRDDYNKRMREGRKRMS